MKNKWMTLILLFIVVICSVQIGIEYFNEYRIKSILEDLDVTLENELIMVDPIASVVLHIRIKGDLPSETLKLKFAVPSSFYLSPVNERTINIIKWKYLGRNIAEEMEFEISKDSTMSPFLIFGSKDYNKSSPPQIHLFIGVNTQSLILPKKLFTKSFSSISKVD